MAYSDKPMKYYYLTINGRQTPVFYPQYFDESLNDWVISSKNDPLPVGDANSLTELQTIKQTQADILNKLNGTLDTSAQLTGRNVEEEPIVIAESITAGAMLEQPIEQKGAKKMIVLVQINQPNRVSTGSTGNSSLEANPHMFPNGYNGDQGTSNGNYPNEYIIGYSLDELTNDTTTRPDALDKAVLFQSPMNFYVLNDGTELATVTLTVVRIWEV